MTNSPSTSSRYIPRSFVEGPAALLSLTAFVFACFTVTPAQAQKKGAPGDEGDGTGEPEKPKNPTACISHTVQARFMSGYDHLVHIKNDCEKSAVCAVSTNVNPQVQQVQVASKSTQTVLTFRGSPAREFSAVVECKFAE